MRRSYHGDLEITIIPFLIEMITTAAPAPTLAITTTTITTTAAPAFSSSSSSSPPPDGIGDGDGVIFSTVSGSTAIKNFEW